jgi:acyl carrier protein
MAPLNSTETIVRKALQDQLAIKQAFFFDLDEGLYLDSLTQAELRVYIEKEFGISTDIQAMPVEATETLNKLISHIDNTVKNKN